MLHQNSILTVTESESAAVYDQLMGERIYVLLDAADTRGAYSVVIDELPPQAGPPLHIHHREDELFYVLAGELVVQLGEDRFILPAGQAAFLPRGVPHTFINAGPKMARILAVVTPGGVERFFAEVEPLATAAEPDLEAVLAAAGRYGIEAVGPPLAELPGVDEAAPRRRPAEVLDYPTGETVGLLVTGSETGGRLAFLEGYFPPGSGTSLHRHTGEDEIIFVIDGTLTCRLDEETGEAGPGSAVYLPRGKYHQTMNESTEPVRALALIGPAGLENYFVEAHALIAQGPPSSETMTALNKKYGLEKLDSE